jgi:hypothetical protein
VSGVWWEEGRVEAAVSAGVVDRARSEAAMEVWAVWGADTEGVSRGSRGAAGEGREA